MKKNNNQNALGNNKYFDPKMGMAGAVVLGTIVFTINFDHGVINALIASVKQAFCTLLAGGFMMRITENISASVPNNRLALVLATLIPSIIATLLTFLLHSLKGTPEPINSTIPTMLLAPPGFLWWAVRKRRQLKLLSLPAQNKINENE